MNEHSAKPTSNVWFWQRIISPHMAGLAAALAEQGCRVSYVAETIMSDERASQGWLQPSLGKAQLKLVPTIDRVDALIQSAPADVIHVCQGIRGNGLISRAQSRLRDLGRRQWVIMETLQDDGWRGLGKRLEYRRLFMQYRRKIEGVLAIGHQTPAWVADRGMPSERVFPFAYFLPHKLPDVTRIPENAASFRFAFVGRFVKVKRLDLLIKAIARLATTNVELLVIGSGPLEAELRKMAEDALGNRVQWLGRLPIDEVQAVMAKTDCLVLPSRYDGWGAVASEALMVGTPVVCSDSCGAAGAVTATGLGGVFRSESLVELTILLEQTVEAGRLDRQARADLASWAQCLGAEAGARYLRAILGHVCLAGERPDAPWV